MRTICYPEKGKVAFEEKAKPVCHSTGVLIKTHYSGLSNGTERNVMMGGNYGGGYPCCPGYQVLGEVVERGREVTHFEVGDLVYCANCGFGHWEYLPAEANSLLVKLEASDDLEVMSLLAIVCVAYRNTIRLKIEPGERALVFGGGVIGQVAAQVAKLNGAEVTLVAGEKDKLEAARALGIDHVLDRHAADFEVRLREMAPWNTVLETSGADVLDLIIGVDWSGGLVANEGRIALVAGRGQITYSSNAAQGRALTLVQSAHFRQEHLDAVVRLVRNGEIRLRPLLREVVEIEDAIAVYERLRDDPSHLLGTVFKW
mgnify:CR=1 FL=1